jgi:hypothetical protein
MDFRLLAAIVVVFLAIVGSAFFAYRASSLKSQLAQVRIDAEKQHNELQSQIGIANTKARESANQLAALKAKADKAQVEAANSLTQSEQLSGQVGALQTQLANARNDFATAKASAQKASAELAKLKTQLQNQPSAAAPVADKVSQVPVVAGKELPLKVTLKKAPLGNGNALTFQNSSTASLPMVAKFSNVTGSREYNLTLEAGGTKELGWLGDWLLASGDKIELKSVGYQTMVKTVP